MTIPSLTFSVLQLAMRNAIESAFNETTLDDAVGGDDDAKKKALLMSNSTTNSMDQIRREPYQSPSAARGLRYRKWPFAKE